MSGCDMFDCGTDNVKNDYTFTFSGDERNIRFNVSVDDFVPWDDVLRHFLDFLGSVYGYNISKYVDVNAPHKDLKDDEDTTT